MRLNVLQTKAFGAAAAADDQCCGHLLVLLQYDWPKYEETFSLVRDRIKRQGSFKYNLFFNYVISILTQAMDVIYWCTY